MADKSPKSDALRLMREARASAKKSDGGSRGQPFDPADAAGVKSGTVTIDGQTGRPNRVKVGAKKIPGSSASSGLAKPIAGGQAPIPSDTHSKPPRGRPRIGESRVPRPEPWKALGMSERTYYRRQAAKKATDK